MADQRFVLLVAGLWEHEKYGRTKNDFNVKRLRADIMYAAQLQAQSSRTQIYQTPRQLPQSQSPLSMNPSD